MTIAFRHPSTNHHVRSWIVAGAAAVVLGAGAYTSLQTFTGPDPSASPASADIAPDPMGLGAALTVRPPLDIAPDPMGLGAALSVQPPLDIAPDPMGLGAALSVSSPIELGSDPMGLGAALSVRHPAG